MTRRRIDELKIYEGFVMVWRHTLEPKANYALSQYTPNASDIIRLKRLIKSNLIDPHIFYFEDSKTVCVCISVYNLPKRE